MEHLGTDEVSYRIHRQDDGSVIAELKCKQCGNWFTVPADDPLFVALICGIKYRFNCGKHNAEEKK